MDELNAKVNDLGQTPLHIAVVKGHVHIVEKLVELMSEEDLEVQDDSGMTAMSLASASGSDTRMLRCMHRKNEKLLTIRDTKGRIPFLVALDAGKIELASYLYSVIQKEDLIQDAKCEFDSSMITALIMGNKLDLALELLRCGRDITTFPDRNGHIPLYALTCRPSTFPSGRQLVFWKKWIYACIHIGDEGLTDDEREDYSTDEGRTDYLSTDEVVINIKEENEERGDQVLKITELGTSLPIKTPFLLHVAPTCMNLFIYGRHTRVNVIREMINIC
ncbi:KN motif and ankyrin repeat domain-containing protein 2 [Morella rubra]|uniref:KN motif and ankyrin repeat domain-containing protein 2 n=1 Tax=Morella rubra TaxID=262757 RepID=A0A6A1WQI7_9ROSI|nr:KN motif and ankyrin repeat domain-containing protein 2 [Morella rubra]